MKSVQNSKIYLKKKQTKKNNNKNKKTKTKKKNKKQKKKINKNKNKNPPRTRRLDTEIVTVSINKIQCSKSPKITDKQSRLICLVYV